MYLLSQRIAERRKQLGFTQEELASKIGTSQRQISFYEKGENDPSAHVLASLADALDTTTDWLLGRTHIQERYLRGTGDLAELEQEAVQLLRSQNVETQQKIVRALKALV